MQQPHSCKQFIMLSTCPILTATFLTSTCPDLLPSGSSIAIAAALFGNYIVNEVVMDLALHSVTVFAKSSRLAPPTNCKQQLHPIFVLHSGHFLITLPPWPFTLPDFRLGVCKHQLLPFFDRGSPLFFGFNPGEAIIPLNPVTFDSLCLDQLCLPLLGTAWIFVDIPGEAFIPLKPATLSLPLFETVLIFGGNHGETTISMEPATFGGLCSAQLCLPFFGTICFFGGNHGEAIIPLKPITFGTLCWVLLCLPLLAVVFIFEGKLGETTIRLEPATFGGLCSAKLCLPFFGAWKTSSPAANPFSSAPKAFKTLPTAASTLQPAPNSCSPTTLERPTLPSASDSQSDDPFLSPGRGDLLSCGDVAQNPGACHGRGSLLTCGDVEENPGPVATVDEEMVPASQCSDLGLPSLQLHDQGSLPSPPWAVALSADIVLQFRAAGMLVDPGALRYGLEHNWPEVPPALPEVAALLPSISGLV